MIIIQTLFWTLLFAILAHGKTKFEITNREPGPIWVGIQGDPGHPHLNNGGFVLVQGQTVMVDAPETWSGKFWPRTWCETYSKHCETGSCGDMIECRGAGGTPPFTLVEIALKKWRDTDYYGVTLENGYNLRGYIEPINGETAPTNSSCTKVGCLVNIDMICPTALRLDTNGQTIGCHSGCTKFNTDEYCCKGYHDRPETCQSTDWPENYAAFFKEHCPQAYSYKYDPEKQVFTCKASHYKIQFGNSF